MRVTYLNPIFAGDPIPDSIRRPDPLLSREDIAFRKIEGFDAQESIIGMPTITIDQAYTLTMPFSDLMKEGDGWRIIKIAAVRFKTLWLVAEQKSDGIICRSTEYPGEIRQASGGDPYIAVTIPAGIKISKHISGDFEFFWEGVWNRAYFSSVHYIFSTQAERDEDAELAQTVHENPADPKKWDTIPNGGEIHIEEIFFHREAPLTPTRRPSPPTESGDGSRSHDSRLSRNPLALMHSLETGGALEIKPTEDSPPTPGACGHAGGC